jgi:hypothetical protein
MLNEPVVIDNFLHIINQRKIANIFQSSEIKWNLKLFPSYGYRLEHLDFDQQDNQTWEDSPALVHALYVKDQVTDPSEQEKYVINLFQQAIEKHIDAKIEIIRCIVSIVTPNPNFTAQCMMPHTDWIVSHETCIYYINSTDGDTVLFDQKYDTSLSVDVNDIKKKNVITKISPVQGRAALFDGLQYHAGNPSKTNLRFVLNINYIRV